jgi:hypothetical protein
VITERVEPHRRNGNQGTACLPSSP